MPYSSIFSRSAFEGEVALVTGGGTGIGRAIAHELVSCGATVVIAARRKEQLEKTATEIRSSYDVDPSKIDTVCMDIGSEESVGTAIKSVIDRHGKISLLVNNAGGQFLALAEQMSTRGFQSVVKLNLFGTWNVMKAVFEASMREHGGSIVNILVAMQNGFPLMSHSGAARAGIENLSRSLAIEWAHYGIRVNSVAPGTIIGNGILQYPKEIVGRVLKEIPSKTVLNRFGTEAEIASASAFLLSRASSYITGATLKVDGGITLSNYPGMPRNEAKNMQIFTGFATLSECIDMEKSPKELKELMSVYLTHNDSSNKSKL